MGHVHPMPTQSEGRDAAVTSPPAAARPVDSVHCGLCGARLSGSLRYHVVSPQSCDMMTVCHTCRKAALGEGYRPAE
jgi:hypothetical protein